MKCNISGTVIPSAPCVDKTTATPLVSTSCESNRGSGRRERAKKCAHLFVLHVGAVRVVRGAGPSLVVGARQAPGDVVRLAGLLDLPQQDNQRQQQQQQRVWGRRGASVSVLQVYVVPSRGRCGVVWCGVVWCGVV